MGAKGLVTPFSLAAVVPSPTAIRTTARKGSRVPTYTPAAFPFPVPEIPQL
jgi:hypothetical protein